MPGDAVRGQYEAYPYPPRDPAAERSRLVTGSPSHIDEIEHYVFGGHLGERLPVRVLVAGGGTGDGTIMLAQQLAVRSPSSEIVYIDISEASLRIAAERAHVRGLRNVRFERVSILDLPKQGWGAFDYIDCCGVLHHLDDSKGGLASLSDALVDDGGIGLMLYGELGRIGVYHVQEMARLLAGDGRDPTRLSLLKRLLANLPVTNWLRRNPFVRDHLDQGDAGLYDLFLHARDRAFTVPQIADLASAAGMRITAFIEPAFYDPSSYLEEATLLTRLAPLSWLQRCAFAELLAGNMRKHVLYLVKQANPVTSPASADPLVVPVLRDLDGDALARNFKSGAAVTASRDGLTLRRPLPDLSPSVLRLIDGRRTLRDLHREIQHSTGALTWEAFAREFDKLFVALNGIGKLYLSYRR